jgi:hypothetical protein
MAPYFRQAPKARQGSPPWSRVIVSPEALRLQSVYFDEPRHADRR